ncbi:MAG: hypothetical protein KAI34_05015 [Candidatus Lokiarchaeota archaeon]|nr:hypothetical protein [Candidatus Lokiarchaeota archaeon]
MINKFLKNKRGSPLIEEVMLIGMAILMFALVISLVFDIFNWTGASTSDLYGELANLWDEFRG